MKRKIFFDLDGTLIDQKAAQNKAIEELYWEYGFNRITDLKAFVSKWDELTEYYYDMYLNRLCTYEGQRIKRVVGLFSFFKMPLDEKDALTVYDVYLEKFERNWTLFDDVVPCLSKLDSLGIELGIITNGDMSQQKLKLERTNIIQYFRYVTAAGDYKYAKPNPEIFRIACQQSNTAKEEMLYVGDSYSSDIVPCKELGIKCLLINRTGENIKDRTVNVINSLDEIWDIIETT